MRRYCYACGDPNDYSASQGRPEKCRNCGQLFVKQQVAAEPAKTPKQNNRAKGAELAKRMLSASSIKIEFDGDY